MDAAKEQQNTIKLLKKQIQELKKNENQLNGNFEKSLPLYQSIFNELPCGCSLNKIVLDKQNKPTDFTIIEMNNAFEEAVKRNRKQLTGQAATCVFPKMESQWISKFAATTTSGDKRNFTAFSFDGENYFNIQIHSPKADYFILTLTRELKENNPATGSIRFYERLMDHLHEGIWVTDKHDTIFFTNQGMVLNTGTDKKDILGRNIQSFEKENLGDFMNNYLNAKKRLKPQQYETKLTTLKGKEAVLEGWLVPLVKDQRFDGMICTIRNISENKKNRQIIDESEEKLRNIIEHSNNVFYSHTINHRLTYVSPQMETLLGYTPEQTKVRWTSLTSDNPINKIGFKLTNKAIRTGKVQKPYKLELVHKNGKLVWVEVREAPVVKNGNTTSIVGALVDITEQIEIAQKLLENQQGLRNLVDESPIPIAINTKDGTIEYLNREFTETFGYNIEDIPNVDRWFERAYPDENYREKTKNLWLTDIKKRLANEEKTSFEANITCKDGSVKFIQILWSYIGEKLVLIFHNMTEYKALEDQIMQKNDELQNALNELQKSNNELQIATQKAKESDQLKSAFLANMSHEIRTPMNSIIGFSSLLAQPQIDEEKRIKYTEFIQKSGTHLLRIIDDIIDIAKIESNQLRIEKSYFSIVPFMENTFDYHLQSNLLKSNTTIKLRLNHALIKAPIIMFTDPIRLKQVFDNLLTNSIKNTNQGVIELGVHKVEKNSITFHVSDTGVGIPENYKKVIFKRFTQVDSKTLRAGTGLGLSIIKGITNLLEGKIWFESEEGVGTTFFVKFKIQPEN